MSTRREAHRASERVSGQVGRLRILAELPVTERRVPVAGTSTVVLEGGGGPPILFLQPEFALVWMRVIPELVTSYRVIAPDLPGLGESSPVGGRYDVGTALEWLGDLIDQTCDAPPVVVGKATAGALAARFAIHHGDRLDRLVLVDPHGLDRYRPPARMAVSFVSVLLRPTERRVERSFDAYCFTDIGRVRAEMGEQWGWLMAYTVDWFRKPSVKATLRGPMYQLARPIPADDLSRITVPTSLIWGRQDIGMPLEVGTAASERYGWPLHIIDDARDDPAMEQPDAFLAALRAAIATESPASRRSEP